MRDAQQTLFYANTIIEPTQLFTYDALYRLVTAEGREQTGSASFGAQDNWNDAQWCVPLGSDAAQRYTQYYTYDEVGNILQLRHIADIGSYSRHYKYTSSSNRLGHTTVGGDSYVYGYDDRGNMINMPHLDAIYWNANNELNKIENGTLGAYYQYSGGQRVRKYVDKGSVKEERIYLGSFEIYRKYDSSNVKIIERTTVHVSDDTGRIAMLEKRTFGDAGDDNGTLDLLTRYIYSNHLQSASLELDEYGEIISYEEYHPYGTTAYQANSTAIAACAKRYRYTGKERDEESGLYYHGARYYVPWLCRWVSPDPINSENYNLAKGYGLEKNLERDFLELTASPYEYCYDNPVRFNDPTGEQVPWKQIGAELGTIPRESVEGIKSFQNSVKNPLAKAANAFSQPFTRMAGKFVISKMNSEIQDQNVAQNSFQVPKIPGSITTQKANSIKTDTDLPSANKFNLYVNTNTMFHVSESNANKFVNYELGVVAALMHNFVTGLGPENYSFPENGITSKKFIENKSMVLKDAITKFLKTPTKDIINEQFEFGGPGLKQDFNQTGTPFSITGLVGSGTITIQNDAARKGVTISIFNITSLTSGALGKELGPESAWPESYMRDGKTRVPYGNISQTFNLFIPYGTTESTKYTNVQKTLDQIK